MISYYLVTAEAVDAAVVTAELAKPVEPAATNASATVRAIALLAVLVLLMGTARSFLPNETSLVGSGATLAFGFVLLAALQCATIFSAMRLPRVTGYLVCGFVAGPSVLDFVTERMLGDLHLVNGVAIGLIALAAGGELNFRRLRPRIRAIVSIGSVSILLTAVLIAVTVFVCSPLLPFMQGLTTYERTVVACVCGIVLSTLSPTVTLAIIEETGAAGPICETLLGVVVMADLAIIFAFAAVNALASSTFHVAGSQGGMEVMIEVVGSIAAGAVLGVVFSVYLRKVAQRVALFVFGVCFVCAEAGTRMHLDPLLMCLTAGLFLENLTEVEGAKLVHDIEAASLPVFAVFFAVAGAGLHWTVFKRVAPVAIALAGVRAVAYFGGSQVGMRFGRVPAAQRKTIPFGMLSQSGIAIGMSVLVGKHFPGWGEGAGACMLGAVMLNEMFGPVLFRGALMRSGEAGKRTPVVGSH